MTRLFKAMSTGTFRPKTTRFASVAVFAIATLLQTAVLRTTVQAETETAVPETVSVPDMLPATDLQLGSDVTDVSVTTPAEPTEPEAITPKAIDLEATETQSAPIPEVVPEVVPEVSDSEQAADDDQTETESAAESELTQTTEDVAPSLEPAIISTPTPSVTINATVVSEVKLETKINLAPETSITPEVSTPLPVATDVPAENSTQVAIATDRTAVVPVPPLDPLKNVVVEEKMTPLARVTLLLQTTMLRHGCRNLKRFSDYSATFTKQESVNGLLGDSQVMELKLRHEPFSVYMKWTAGDRGRELLYSKETNDGKLVVHAGGWKARLIPALKLDPNGALAMRESRHPVTKIGLYNLTEEMLDYRRRDLELNHNVRCDVKENETFDGRECYCFEMEYLNPAQSEVYRKSVAFIDRELCIPLCILNYTWPHEEFDPTVDLDEHTLIEKYSYTNLNFDRGLDDVHFDLTNKEYAFRR